MVLRRVVPYRPAQAVSSGFADEQTAKINETHSGTLPKPAASLANVSEFLLTTWSEASRSDHHAFVRLCSAGPLPIKICRYSTGALNALGTAHDLSFPSPLEWQCWLRLLKGRLV